MCITAPYACVARTAAWAARAPIISRGRGRTEAMRYYAKQQSGRGLGRGLLGCVGCFASQRSVPIISCCSSTVPVRKYGCVYDIHIVYTDIPPQFTYLADISRTYGRVPNCLYRRSGLDQARWYLRAGITLWGPGHSTEIRIKRVLGTCLSPSPLRFWTCLSAIA